MSHHHLEMKVEQLEIWGIHKAYAIEIVRLNPTAAVRDLYQAAMQAISKTQIAPHQSHQFPQDHQHQVHQHIHHSQPPLFSQSSHQHHQQHQQHHQHHHHHQHHLEKRSRSGSIIIHPDRPLYHADAFHEEQLGSRPSPETLEKANTCKFVLSQHFVNLHRARVARVRRKQSLEEQMTTQVFSESQKEFFRQKLYNRETEHLRASRAIIKPEDFEQVKLIGRGAFGRVVLAKHHESDQYYAMKIMDKATIIKRQQLAHVRAERDVMAEADNEWVVRLYFSFQDEVNLYFVMDYAAGGDLLHLLTKVQHMPEQVALFYLVELVLAVQSVHSMGFIHRDLKPDNILICADGHIKLTDFGLCTGLRWQHKRPVCDSSEPGSESLMEVDSEDIPLIMDQTRSMADSLVGTPNYIAPEVFRRQAYDHRCDWWSLGVILYEMVVGRPPFFDTSPERTRERVINHRVSLQFPPRPKVSDTCKDLIFKFCSDVETRIGSQGGVEEIQRHPFFLGVTWNRKNKPPFRPDLKSADDTQNFDVGLDDKKFHTIGTPNEGIISPLQHQIFREFTFRRFWIGSNATL